MDSSNSLCGLLNREGYVTSELVNVEIVYERYMSQYLLGLSCLQTQLYKNQQKTKHIHWNN